MTSTTANHPAEIRPSGTWLIILGIVMTALGVVGIAMATYLTIAAVFWFGALAIVAGIAQIFDVVHHKGWKAIVWHLLLGFLYVAAGIVMIATPLRAAFILTVLIAISLVATGLVRLVMAFTTRKLGTGATIGLVLSAILSIVLGVVLYGLVTPPGAEALATPEAQRAWVASWGWVIGLFVSVELIVQGLALLTLGAVARRAASAPPSAGADTTGAAPA